MTDLTVAQIIKEQLGGGRFEAMTGAHSFVGDDKSLTFRLPGRGANGVRIELLATDEYTIIFFKIRRTKYKECARFENVQAHQLCTVFTEATGLAVRL